MWHKFELVYHSRRGIFLLVDLPADFLGFESNVWVAMQELFQEGYGTVLDSGTTFTYLPTKAFEEFVNHVTAYATERKLKVVDGPDPKVLFLLPFLRVQASIS